MELKEIIERAKKELQAMMNLELSSVTGVYKIEDGGWKVKIELIERKAIPDAQDLLGMYEVQLNDDGHVIGFDRKKVRRRMDVEETSE